MPTDFPPPDEFAAPPLPDWLGSLAELDLPFPESAPFEPPIPAGFDVATPAPRLTAPPVSVAPSVVVTPPPRGALVPMAADPGRAEVRRELPVRLVRGTDPATTCWQLTVAPTWLNAAGGLPPSAPLAKAFMSNEYTPEQSFAGAGLPPAAVPGARRTAAPMHSVPPPNGFAARPFVP